MLNVVSQTGLRFLWISAVTVLLDLWSKYEVMAKMDLYESIQVMPFFNFTYVHNYGEPKLNTGTKRLMGMMSMW